MTHTRTIICNMSVTSLRYNTKHAKQKYLTQHALIFGTKTKLKQWHHHLNGVLYTKQLFSIKFNSGHSVMVRNIASDFRCVVFVVAEWVFSSHFKLRAHTVRIYLTFDHNYTQTHRHQPNHPKLILKTIFKRRKVLTTLLVRWSTCVLLN